MGRRKSSDIDSLTHTGVGTRETDGSRNSAASARHLNLGTAHLMNEQPISRTPEALIRLIHAQRIGRLGTRWQIEELVSFCQKQHLYSI